MEIRSLRIEGAWVASSPVWTDNRGSFREWFKASDIRDATGLDFSVAQANLSESNRGVLRGLHFSLARSGQAKWITCVTGSIRDVIVDIRLGSPTYGKFEAVDLFGGSGDVVLIGSGLGHGFVSLTDGATVAYLVNSPFTPTEEFEIDPLDPSIGIDWVIPHAELILSSKDADAPSLNELAKRGGLPLS